MSDLFQVIHRIYSMLQTSDGLLFYPRRETWTKRAQENTRPSKQANKLSEGSGVLQWWIVETVGEAAGGARAVHAGTAAHLLLETGGFGSHACDHWQTFSWYSAVLNIRLNNDMLIKLWWFLDVTVLKK